MMFKTLYDLAQQKFAGSDSEMPLDQWITENTSYKRRPFTYDRYPFQRRIAGDDHPNLSVIKCSQIGLTEIQIRKFLAILRRNNGLSGIFSFANEDMRRRTYSTRVGPIVSVDDAFNPPMVDKPIRRQDLVQIGDSFGYFTGCTESEATNIPADILFHDEYDLSPQEIISLYQSRLQGSDYKITQAFSTPTFLGWGIDRQFSLSDQHYYKVKCDSCNHWQFPIFNHKFIYIPNLDSDAEKLTDYTTEQIADIDFKGAYVGCERCQKRLDLADPRKRAWVAMLPSRTENRGYKVNPFSTDRINLEYIFRQLSSYKDKDNLKGFYNTVLGEPFTESNAQIQKHEIEACMAPHGRPPEVSKDTSVFMGVDMGQICHIVLLGEHTRDGKDPFFLFDSVSIHHLAERIADLRATYSIVQGCVDRYPYTPTVDAFRDMSNGLIMPVHYAGNAIIQQKIDEGDNVIYYMANRTATLDRVRTSIINNMASLEGYGSYKETIMTHLRDMVRDETPEKEPVWKKLNGNDHFFHAMAMALLARRVSEHLYTSNYSKNVTVLSISGESMGKDVIHDLTKNKGAANYGFARHV